MPWRRCISHISGAIFMKFGRAPTTDRIFISTSRMFSVTARRTGCVSCRVEVPLPGSLRSRFAGFRGEADWPLTHEAGQKILNGVQPLEEGAEIPPGKFPSPG